MYVYIYIYIWSLYKDGTCTGILSLSPEHQPPLMPLPFQGISAEHGIGQCKPQFLHLSKADSAVNLMKTLGWGKWWAPWRIRQDAIMRSSHELRWCLVVVCFFRHWVFLTHWSWCKSLELAGFASISWWSTAGCVLSAKLQATCCERCDTVDSWNPASVDMVTIPLFTGFHTSQVVVWISEPSAVPPLCWSTWYLLVKLRTNLANKNPRTMKAMMDPKGILNPYKVLT